MEELTFDNTDMPVLMKNERERPQMSDTKIKILISEMENHRGLWDKAHPLFLNNSLKKDVWAEIFAKFEEAPGFVYQKWTTLKTRFKEEMKKYKIKPGDKYTGNWPHFESLTFLYDIDPFKKILKAHETIHNKMKKNDKNNILIDEPKNIGTHYINIQPKLVSKPKLNKSKIIKIWDGSRVIKLQAYSNKNCSNENDPLAEVKKISHGSFIDTIRPNQNVNENLGSEDYSGSQETPESQEEIEENTPEEVITIDDGLSDDDEPTPKIRKLNGDDLKDQNISNHSRVHNAEDLNTSKHSRVHNAEDINTSSHSQVHNAEHLNTSKHSRVHNAEDLNTSKHSRVHNAEDINTSNHSQVHNAENLNTSKPKYPTSEVSISSDTDEQYDEMFLKSLTPYFRNLDRVKKLQLRGKIVELLIKETCDNQR